MKRLFLAIVFLCMTELAGAQPPSDRTTPGEFPPKGASRRIVGTLVNAHFIHRTGQFRVETTGELVSFSMMPFASIWHLGAEADLRDLPLGTTFTFSLLPDAQGQFTRLATMHDRFTADTRLGVICRFAELKLDQGQLIATRHYASDLNRTPASEVIPVSEQTRVWKTDAQVRLKDLSPGETLRFNLHGTTQTRSARCLDLWVGDDTHRRVTEKRQKLHAEFIKVRGVPGWIDRAERDILSVTLFSGDRQSFLRDFGAAFIKGGDVRVVVANDELRTWNPPVDQERSKILAVREHSENIEGSSGVQVEVRVANLLEGFRKGRVVRLFGAAWPSKDQDYGESLMGYGFSRLATAEIVETPPREYPSQFPFRTDYGNTHLAWYKIKPGVVPPRFSEHIVLGELADVDPGKKSGHFRTDRSGEIVAFTLLPGAEIRVRNIASDLADLPIGSRCRFHLYQDDQGVFRWVSAACDEFSYLAQNVITYRIERVNIAEGILHVARQIPKVKNYNGDMVQPPDIGRAELQVDRQTRVWRGDIRAALDALTVGDEILVNINGELPGRPSCCTDIWIGSDTHRLLAEPKTKTKAAPKR